jgi:putative two-component system response regulator
MVQSSSFLDFLLPLFDPHGGEHAANVSDHASLLARAAGLDAQQVEQIELAGRYHDIGKIAIPESIRRFPGIYTQIERQAIQKHTEIGAQLLQHLHFDPQVIAIVLDHHENYDGSGYPMGLRGEAIPVGARIIRIVDCFDALTHHRGYRFAYSEKRALQKMEAARQQFDPDLFQFFLESISKRTWIRQG